MTVKPGVTATSRPATVFETALRLRSRAEAGPGRRVSLLPRRGRSRRKAFRQRTSHHWSILNLEFLGVRTPWQGSPPLIAALRASLARVRAWFGVKVPTLPTIGGASALLVPILHQIRGCRSASPEFRSPFNAPSPAFHVKRRRGWKCYVPSLAQAARTAPGRAALGQSSNVLRCSLVTR